MKNFKLNSMDKPVYSQPKVELIKFNYTDVISTSLCSPFVDCPFKNEGKKTETWRNTLENFID